MKFPQQPREQIILIVTIVVMIPIFIVIGQNVRHSISIGSQIRALNREAEIYEQSIERDSLLLERIKFDDGLEQFARETYFMQRRGERLYIFED